MSIGAKITSLKQLGHTRTTYENFLKYRKPNYEKIRSYKQFALEKRKNLIMFFNTKAHNSKEKFRSASRVSRCSQSKRQDIIG